MVALSILDAGTNLTFFNEAGGLHKSLNYARVQLQYFIIVGAIPCGCPYYESPALYDILFGENRI